MISRSQVHGLSPGRSIQVPVAVPVLLYEVISPLAELMTAVLVTMPLQVVGIVPDTVQITCHHEYIESISKVNHGISHIQ